MSKTFFQGGEKFPSVGHRPPCAHLVTDLILSTCLSRSFVLTRFPTLNWLKKILMQPISNVHAGRICPVGRRFPTHALDELRGSNQNLDTCGDAHAILDAIQSFTFFSFLMFKKVILRESHEAQNNLQKNCR